MYNLWIVKNYLQHRFKATTRHGLHSPFIYRLVDEVVYDMAEKKVYAEIEHAFKHSYANSARKLNRLLYRLVANYQPNSVLLLGKVDPITQSYIEQATSCKDVFSASVDFILINTDNGKEAIHYVEQNLPDMTENTLLVLNGIYANEEMLKAWNTIKTNIQVSVTVDLFWVGLVFFRKGQAKEDFWIKW